jgi:predicted esterase
MTKKRWLFLVFGLVLLVVIGVFSLIWIRKKRDNKELQTFIQPAQKNHSATVIILHGLGDKAENWITATKQVKDKYPYIKFIIPQAPIISVSIKGGKKMSAWYDLKGDPHDFLNLQEDKTSLLNSVAKIKQIIQQEINQDIVPRRILVVGFSQGAAVAIAVGLMTDYPLGAVIGLSSFLPLRKEMFRLVENKNKTIPFFLYHNRLDNVIPVQIGAESAKILKANGYQVEFSDKYSGGHSFKPEKLGKIAQEVLDKFIPPVG